MANIAIFRINYKSDFILTLNSDAGWMTPFCIKFWTGVPSQAYFVGFDGTTYTHCAPVVGEPTKLRVQFDDHHLPIGDLKFQIAYHFTVADFPTSVEDEVLNQSSVIIEVDDAPAQVMLDLNGETAPEIEFSLPACANEAQRIANEQARIAAEQQRIANEESRIAAESIRQQNEAQRIQHETARVNEFARLKRESEQATTDANAAAALASEKAQLAADKAALAQASATLANEKAQLAADKAALAQAAADLANAKAALAQQKAEYAQTQGDYAKAQGDIALADHDRAESDHTQAVQDHERAESDHAALENVPDSVPSTSPTDLSGNVEDVYLKNRSTNNPQAPRTLARLVTDSGKNRPLNESLTRLAEYQSLGFPAFSTNVDYAEGEPCFHDRRLYKAKAGGHPAGVWNSAHFEEFSVKEYVDAQTSVFDVTAKNPTAGPNSDGKFTLEYILSNANTLIPAPFRRGGISISFVQSSDNKYVQFRYMGTATTGNPNPFLNTDNWAFCSDDILTDNPEFMYVETDATGKVMHSVSAEDGAYWFHKLKSPTLDNMMKEVQDFKEEIESEVEQAIEDSQTELAQHYDYYNVSKHHSVRDVFNIYTVNDGWEQIEYNSSLIQYDELDVYQIGEQCNYGGDTEHSYEATSSHRGVAPATITQEYITRTKFTLEEAIAVLPEEVLTSFAAGQKICFVDLDDIIEEWQITEVGTWERTSPYEVKDPEDRCEIKLDGNKKIVAYRKADGTWVECVGIEAPNLGNYVEKEERRSLIDAEYADGKYTIDDPEGRLNLELDGNKKIVSERDEDGMLHENVGIETPVVNTNSLNLTEQGMTDFQQALKDSGFQPGGGGDASERDNIEVPEPQGYVLLNLIVPKLPNQRNESIDGECEYYDFAGNYFKISCSLEVQGQTSGIYAITGGKGNYTLDTPKDLKFGSWVPQDSFHLKGCSKDITRGFLPTSYKYAYKVMEALDAKPNRVLKKANNKTSTTFASGDRFTDFFDEARCLPDGFPAEIYVNGEYWGLYSFQLKKHRKNYSMKKSDYKSFFLDAEKMMTDDYQNGFWNDGVDSLVPNTSNKWWNYIDIKNPKDLICMDGSAFDGDAPKELIDDTATGIWNPDNAKMVGSAQTKALIRAFSIRYLEVQGLINNSQIEQAKAKFNEYFDYNACMFVYIFNCMMRNQDSIKKNTLWAIYKGGKIAPMLWDLDAMYGTGWVGISAGSPTAELFFSNNANVKTYANSKWPLGLFWTLYSDEIKAAYAELRRTSIISIDTWRDVVFGWCKRIGMETYNRDYDKWDETTSYRENYTDTDYWEEGSYIEGIGNNNLWQDDVNYNPDTYVVLRMHPQSNWYLRYKCIQTNGPGTEAGVKCPVTEFYDLFPQVGGYYDSPKRMEKWMDEQLYLCDLKMQYYGDVLADFTAYRSTDLDYTIQCLDMNIEGSMSGDYKYIEGHITRHEEEVEGQTVSIYTITGGVVKDNGTSDYTTVRAAVETASQQAADVPSENVFYIKARVRDVVYKKKN